MIKNNKNEKKFASLLSLINIIIWKKDRFSEDSVYFSLLAQDNQKNKQSCLHTNHKKLTSLVHQHKPQQASPFELNDSIVMSDFN